MGQYVSHPDVVSRIRAGLGDGAIGVRLCNRLLNGGRRVMAVNEGLSSSISDRVLVSWPVRRNKTFVKDLTAARKAELHRICLKAFADYREQYGGLSPSDLRYRHSFGKTVINGQDRSCESVEQSLRQKGGVQKSCFVASTSIESWIRGIGACAAMPYGRIMHAIFVESETTTWVLYQCRLFDICAQWFQQYGVVNVDRHGTIVVPPWCLGNRVMLMGHPNRDDRLAGWLIAVPLLN
jgi:hypothetical protein